MNRRNNRNPNNNATQPTVASPTGIPAAVPAEPLPKPVQKEASGEEKIPKHKQCPSCFSGFGGVGKRKWWRRVSGVLTRMCYSCDQCGYNWAVDVRTTISEESNQPIQRPIQDDKL